MAKTLSVERTYESLFICPSDTPQKNIDGFIEKVKTTIAPTKGILRGVQIWGRRRLTYPIKHQRDGLYVFLDFTGEKGTPESLKNLYRVTDFVIRFMTTDKVNLRPPYVPKPIQAAAPAGTEGTAAAPAAPAAAPSAPISQKTAPSN